MGFYERRILPWLLHLSMRQKRLDPYRQRAIAGAHGRTLEIGAGSGLNFPLYSAHVSLVCAIDPSAELLKMAKKRAQATPSIVLVRATAEHLPFGDRSFDTIVTTWTLCTIPDVSGALHEMHRVLKPDGRLLFVEHGLAPEHGVARWQDWLTPCWKHVGGGCHLNRKMDDLIRAAGFGVEHLRTGYMSGPRILTYMYEGVATPNRI